MHVLNIHHEAYPVPVCAVDTACRLKIVFIYTCIPLKLTAKDYLVVQRVTK